MAALSPPYPWFGGKRRVAPLIWQALGDPKNVIVPFAGGLGDLLGRPTPPQREVINDIDAFIVNFWRAVRSAPEEVWYWADDMVSEIDLHSRNRWLVAQCQLGEKLLADPEYCDARIAGWWVWGQSAWIASGWADTKAKRLPRSIPRAQLSGVHLLALSDIKALAERMRRVVVTCGDWKRVVTPAYLGQGGTGVILDPPYSEGAKVYTKHDRSVSAEAREWAIEHGDDPALRIVLCGYEGEHKMPRRWRVRAWKAAGGYGNARKNGVNVNRSRERLWFSPHCLPVPRT